MDVFWRDNSTGCKQVCDPSHFEEYAARTDAELCDATGCFDEILLKDIDALVADRSRDHFIVLHQRGSHGPAYHTDVPAWSKEFLPECDRPDLRNCDLERINNAYDNTILYTDYFLSRVIDFLAAHETHTKSGCCTSRTTESRLARTAYICTDCRTPSRLMSRRACRCFFGDRTASSRAPASRESCVESAAASDLSHDWIFHTVLPLFGVVGKSYDASLDALATCRQRASDGRAGSPTAGAPG